MSNRMEDTLVINANIDFVPKGRIAWSGNSFSRIAAKWGTLLDVDDREDKWEKYWIRANETVGWVPDFTDESDDEEQDEFNYDNDGNDNDEGLMNTKEDEEAQNSNTDKSDDPFNIYPLLNKGNISVGCENVSNSLEFLPGFTLATEKVEVHTKKVDANSNEKEWVSRKLGGILCIWDTYSFIKQNVTVSDYFIIIGGTWHYLQHVIGKWKGEVITMGDFNEVRYKSDRFGSSFNVIGANIFNSFITNSGLVEVNHGGCRYTWCHKSAKKMSKLDRFLVLKNLLTSCPNINAITLEKYLSDHRPILLRENAYDYGPTPFCYFHHWIEVDGFRKLVEESWRNSPSEGPNAMKILMGKL
nr:RNA-directed DNA polymerase, eukaryota [Tanacetum cinerariifolium]